MSELKTLQAELAAGKQRIKEIEARIASIEGTDKPEAKPIKAWVAMDDDEEIFIYENEPTKLGLYYNPNGGWVERFNKKYLPFKSLIWDRTPVEIEITIKKV